MLTRTMRSIALGISSLAFAMLVGCATEAPKPEADAAATAAAAQKEAAAAAAQKEAAARAAAEQAKVAAEAQPKPAAPKAPPKPVVEKVTLATDTHFDFDKSVVRPDGKKKLDALVGNMKGIELEVVIAIGHTCSIGSDAYNQKLSERRAASVKAYLISRGIERNRVYTEGKGEKQPTATNKTIEGRRKNRRVEVEVIGTRKP